LPLAYGLEDRFWRLLVSSISVADIIVGKEKAFFTGGRLENLMRNGISNKDILFYRGVS
jgi:hypothetical protein